MKVLSFTCDRSLGARSNTWNGSVSFTVTVALSVCTTSCLPVALAIVPRSIVIVSAPTAAGWLCAGALVSMLPALDPRPHAAQMTTATGTVTRSVNNRALLFCISSVLWGTLGRLQLSCFGRDKLTLVEHRRAAQSPWRTSDRAGQPICQ